MGSEKDAPPTYEELNFQRNDNGYVDVGQKDGDYVDFGLKDGGYVDFGKKDGGYFDVSAFTVSLKYSKEPLIVLLFGPRDIGRPVTCY